MIKPEFFYSSLKKNDIEFFAGVPDSLLKSFCAYVTEKSGKDNHVITANEGAAVGLGIGYHMATNKVPAIYMQNSGLGNIINPIMSLADKEVYSIPMLLIVGWRGEPGKKDEPQHVKQGRVMLPTLDAMEIPYTILDGSSNDDAENAIKQANEYFEKNSAPYAIVIKKGTFDSYSLEAETRSRFEMTREQAIEIILSELSDSDIVVSTTGMASREVFELREKFNQTHEKDFLTVGGMGHASQIALGVTLGQSERNVICIDGDGSTLMHMGSLAINGLAAKKNFKHIVINNGAHDSVGGQPTVGFNIDMINVATSCGYVHAEMCQTSDVLADKIQAFLTKPGPSFLEVQVKKGNRSDIGRPTSTPIENKNNFMKFLKR